MNIEPTMAAEVCIVTCGVDGFTAAGRPGVNEWHYFLANSRPVAICRFCSRPTFFYASTKRLLREGHQ
jgi:hypothetical protein